MAGKALASGRGPPLPSDASAALCAWVYLRQCQFEGAKCSTERPSSRFVGHLSLGTLVLCEQPATLRSSAAGSPLSVTPLAGTSHVKKSNRLLLRGKPTASLSPAAIPPHLCRDESRQKCSGQPGCSRSGCWCRQCQNKSATDCAGGHRQCKGYAHQPHPSIQRCYELSRLRPWRPSPSPRCRSLSGSGSL